MGVSRRREPERSASWALRLAWVLLLVPVAAFVFYLKAPPAWLAAVGLERGGGATAVAVGQLPALPPGGDPAAAAAPAWQFHRAAPVVAAPDVPLIAIVLTGLGRSQPDTLAAISLPAPLSLAFSPHARPFDTTLVAARAAGHEVLVDLPMEGGAGDSGAGDLGSGPGALLTLLDVPQNLQRLDDLLGRDEPLAGAVVLGGERFLLADDLAAPVLARLAERGLLLVAPRLQDLEAIALPGAPLLLADRRLGDDSAGGELLLAETERSALMTGSAVAVLPAAPEVLAELRRWSGSLAERGFVLVPATQVLERRQAAP